MRADFGAMTEIDQTLFIVTITARLRTNTDGKERVDMTEMEYIKHLEKRIDFLEKTLEQYITALNRVVNMMLKKTEELSQTDCAWK